MLLKIIGYFLSLSLVSSCATAANTGHSESVATRKTASTENPQCPGPCSLDEVCMNTFTPAGAKCSLVPASAPVPNIILPFDNDTEVICTHSSGSGSHSGENAFYAIDLANDYSQPAAIIRAAADGIAYVLKGEDGKLCPEPEGQPSSAKASTCGDSWGNRVKVLHENGYFTFYAHLDHPLVKSGDVVHRGAPIGVEGWTGAAGHRHLHWSVQKLPGSTTQEWNQQILSYTGTSVPFHFKALQNGLVQDFDIAKVVCPHAGIGQAPVDQQARFRGTKSP